MICLATRIKCKADYAFSVNFIAPGIILAKEPSCLHMLPLGPLYYMELRHFLLDTFHAYGIIKFTQKAKFALRSIRFIRAIIVCPPT